jgi:hypothetical protein
VIDTAGGDVSGGVSAIGVYQAIASIGSGWTTGGLLNPGGGLGASALRGIAASGLRAQQAALALQTVGAKINAAQAQASGRFVESEHPFLHTEPAVTPATKALAAQVTKAQTALAAARGTRHQARAERAVAHAEAKQATMAAKLLPQANFVYVAEYGVANGQPVRGSRDDPAGPIYPNVRTSLMGG